MVKNTAYYVSSTIDAFLNDKQTEWEWDDFISTPLSEIYFDGIRKICLGIPDISPPTSVGEYCGDEGYHLLNIVLKELLKHQ